MPYIGQVIELPGGLGTLTSNNSVAQRKPFDVIQAEGVVSEMGVWQRERGAILYAPTPIPGEICALLDHWPNLTVQRLLAASSNGVIYKSSGGDFVPLTLATAVPTRGHFVSGGQEGAALPRKAFYFNGLERVQVLKADELITTDLGGWNDPGPDTANPLRKKLPDEWITAPPLAAAIHRQRLWAGGSESSPHTIYASSATDHEDFTNAIADGPYSLTIYPGIGQRVVTMRSFKGMLFVFKYPRGVFWMDDQDVDSASWFVSQLTDAIGVCKSPYAALVMDDDIMFLSADGHFHMVSAITNGGVTASDLTVILNQQQWIKDHVNLARLDQVESYWFAAKRLAMWVLPGASSTTNNLKILFDFSNLGGEGSGVRVSYSHRDIGNALAGRRDVTGAERPILGDNVGQVWLLDQESIAKIGAGGVPDRSQGQGIFQTTHTDFSFAEPSVVSKRKNFDALAIVFQGTGNWNIAYDSIIDGRYRETLFFNMGAAGFILGSSHLGDALGGGSITKTTRRRMTGNGYRLSLTGRNTGYAQDFAIAKQIVSLRVAGEEQR